MHKDCMTTRNGRSSRGIFGLAAVLALLPGVTLGAPIRFIVNGTVESATLPGVAVGDPFTFTLLFDPADRTPNSTTTPATANYGLNGATVRAVIGAVTLPDTVFSSGRRLALFDDGPGNNRLNNTLLFNDGGGVVGSWGFSFEARGPTEMLSSIVPPSTAAGYQTIVNAATTRNMSLFNCADVECTTSQRARAAIVSWSFVDVPTAVPAPATLGLMLAALAGLAMSRRRERDGTQARAMLKAPPPARSV